MKGTRWWLFVLVMFAVLTVPIYGGYGVWLVWETYGSPAGLAALLLWASVILGTMMWADES